MEDNLFPVEYESAEITEEDLMSEEKVGYRNGIAFDNELGDFKRDGMNKILDATGLESFECWCINCIQTERYKHLAYSTDFGIETEEALKSKSREEAESILTRQITEALLADPYERVDYIEDITFDWSQPDTIEVKLIIHGIDDVTLDITAYITKGEM